MKRLMYSNSLFPLPVGISNERMTLVECPKCEADDVISKYHYSGKATTNSFLSLSVNGGKGYLQLGYGIRPAMKAKIHANIRKGNFAEFDRMWLSDDLPKNSESMCIALLISYIRQAYPHIKYIITYADGSAGNVGTIYQASNAIYIGSIPCDFYVLSSGERVHPVSMYHRHGTRAWATLQKIYPDIKHIKGEKRQHRYLYLLDKAERRRWIMNNIAIDYPKIAIAA